MGVIASLVGSAVLLYLVIRGGAAVMSDFKNKQTPPATKEDDK